MGACYNPRPSLYPTRRFIITRLSTLALILLFAPFILFVLDQMGVPVPVDELTLSVVLGAVGVLLLAVSQRHKPRRAIFAAVLGIIIVVAQVYGIALLVLGQSF